MPAKYTVERMGLIISALPNKIPMQTFKHIQFSRLIKINGRLHEFNFRQRTDGYYDADTSDDRGNRIQFRLIQQEGEWIIEGKDIPAWITGNNKIIAESLNQ